MKLGIISDTHDQVEKIKKAITIFNKEKVQLVYHLGDWCSPFTLQLFGNLKCSCKGIFGNNDSDIYRFYRYKPKNLEFFGRLYVDEVEGRSVCLFHGDPQEFVDLLFDSRKYDILLTGHDHIARIRQNERTLHINSGNLIGKFNEHTKEWTKPSIAISDLKVSKLIRL